MARGYVKLQSLGLQFQHDIMSKVQGMVDEKVLAILKNFAHDLCEEFKRNRLFYNVTGNTYTSFYVDIYHKGKFVALVTSAEGEDMPTRPTLKEGEVYNLPQYYEGDDVDDDHPFRASTGKGGQWGPNLFYGRRGKFGRPSADWAVICVCPVEYAKFVDTIFKTVYETYETMPDLFSASVIEIKYSTINDEV